MEKVPAHRSKFNRPLPWILGLMATGILVVGGTIVWVVQKPATESELDRLTVLAKRENLAIEIKASGKVQPIDSVNISPKNPGRLLQLGVEQGSVVKQGQLLAVMENDEVRAQGLQAQADFKQAVASYEEARVNIPSDIKQLKAYALQAQARMAQAQARIDEAKARLEQAKARIPREVEQAQAQLRAADARWKLAKSRLERNRSLMDQGAISADRFDELQKEFLDATAGVKEAIERVEQAKNTAQPEVNQIREEIHSLEASLGEAQMDFAQKQIALDQRQKTQNTELERLKAAAASAEAELARVKVLFRDTFITAPFDGIITQKYANVGAFVTPTTSASSDASATSSSIIAIARGLEVVAKVPEVDIGQIKLKQPVKIVADAYPDQEFFGVVKLIAPAAIVEQNVTSFEVKIALIKRKDDPSQKQLLPNMNVDATFVGQPIADALVVPNVAIVTEKGETGVMVPDINNDNQPKFQPVTIGLVIDDKTQILDGINDGQRVFIDLPENQEPPEEEK